ncbi:pectate lyase 13 [Pyrus ussuriensis x Pyrus communis]|uniref:Pectate lyase 13 n=1 Tax=Pyrus ussuriensis x Pyrus communis TaxID=2448454 RepID=A0A5N5FEW9_9ROSA|nr:pectate lyase 13 [Pyrus ussuriensis x Pyrus communis]
MLRIGRMLNRVSDYIDQALFTSHGVHAEPNATIGELLAVVAPVLVEPDRQLGCQCMICANPAGIKNLKKKKKVQGERERERKRDIKRDENQQI